MAASPHRRLDQLVEGQRPVWNAQDVGSLGRAHTGMDHPTPLSYRGPVLAMGVDYKGPRVGQIAGGEGVEDDGHQI